MKKDWRIIATRQNGGERQLQEVQGEDYRKYHRRDIHCIIVSCMKGKDGTETYRYSLSSVPHILARSPIPILPSSSGEKALPRRYSFEKEGDKGPLELLIEVRLIRSLAKFEPQFGGAKAGDVGLLVGGGWDKRRCGVGWKRRAVYNSVKPTSSPISPATAFSFHLNTRIQMPHNTAPMTRAFSQPLLVIFIDRFHIRS